MAQDTGTISPNDKHLSMRFNYHNDLDADLESPVAILWFSAEEEKREFLGWIKDR